MCKWHLAHHTELLTDISIAEEIENASVIVPKSMIWAFLLNIPFAFGLLLTYLFCMPDVQSALDSPTGFPFIHVFRQAVDNTAGATILVVIVLVLIVMITISSLASASRQTFAFARDNGLPFSNWLGEVSSILSLVRCPIIVRYNLHVAPFFFFFFFSRLTHDYISRSTLSLSLVFSRWQCLSSTLALPSPSMLCSPYQPQR